MFCPNCGATVQGRFCAKCGTAVDTGSAPGTASQSNAAPGAQPYIAPTTTGMSENLAGALCYILGLITGIVFLALAPYNQNKFVRFHAFQSIFFNVAWIVFWMIEIAMGFTLPWYLMSFISLIVTLVFLAGWLICMFKAYNHERFKLPVIGDLAEKQA